MNTQTETLSRTDKLVYQFYYGRTKRVCRALIRRLQKLQPERRIWYGPLRGQRWVAGELSCEVGIYEMDVQATILHRLQRGGVFYDVGANRGFFSLLASQIVGGNGHVYAFEPFPQNVAEIRRMAEANRLNNLTVLPNAVSDRRGTTELFVSNDAVTPTLVARPGDRPMPIETITLDEFAAANRWPTFVKMDIEGAEEMALGASKHLLADARPITWLIECHSDKLEAAVYQMFKDHGYQTRILLPPHLRGKSIERHLLAWK